MTAGSFAVIIVSHNGLELLQKCLASVFASPDAPPAHQVVVVDNASSDGTTDFLERHYPQVTCIVSPTNRGFAGGNNIGFAHVRSALPRCRYVVLLNQDTAVKPGWAEQLVGLADARPEAGSVQCKLLFHPSVVDSDGQGPELINSAGNESHYLGFGSVTAYRKTNEQVGNVRPVAFCSGAAMLVRVSAVGRKELFPEEYFAYLEDAELGWRLRLAGYENLYCPQSIVYHYYHFSRNPDYYFRLESNRWRLLLAYYRWPTLALLVPAILMMEAGLLFYFIKVGALGEKLRFWTVLAEIPSILARRHEAQRARRITDRQLTASFATKIEFPEVRNPLLEYLGNPLLHLYWFMARLVLWW